MPSEQLTQENISACKSVAINLCLLFQILCAAAYTTYTNTYMRLLGSIYYLCIGRYMNQEFSSYVKKKKFQYNNDKITVETTQQPLWDDIRHITQMDTSLSSSFYQTWINLVSHKKLTCVSLHMICAKKLNQRRYQSQNNNQQQQYQ